VAGVSIETGQHDSRTAYETTLGIIQNAPSTIPAPIYEVFGTISDPGEYVNLSLHPEGFVPILAGEKAYEYYGFMARRVA
jgi:hypothetical protein